METTTLDAVPRRLNKTKSTPGDLRAWITSECKRLGVSEESFKNLALRSMMESGLTVQLAPVNQEEVN